MKLSPRSLRSILSFIAMLLIGFGMAGFGWLLRDSYSDGQSAIILSFMLSVIAASVIWMIWNLQISLRDDPQVHQNLTHQSDENGLEKRKRDRIDNVLRDLSDEDLLRLKQRLMDGTVDDSVLESQLVGEDGELIYMDNRS